MSENRLRRHFASRAVRRTAPLNAAMPAATAAPSAFMPVPVATAPQAFMAEVYRLAYAAALARVVARRRCSAPFSLN